VFQPVRGLLFCLVVSALASGVRADRLVLVAGGGTLGDGSRATDAQLHSPFGIGYDHLGNLFIVELEGGHVHKVDAKGILSTIAGNGTRGDAGDGGPASGAVFNAMHNLALAANGDLYIADTLNHRVRRIDARTGVISTFAGTGQKGFSGDGGPALAATFNGVYCIAFNPDRSRLVIADLENRRIRAIDMKTGLIDTIAGNGQKGVPADGSEARTAPLVDPRAVAADAAGNVFILERAGHALRVLDKTGRIRTIAGTGQPGGTGDGGDARQATLRGPKHLCIDADGNVIIADTDNHVIRRYLSKTGTIERVAGTGKKGAAGPGGPPTQVELNFPHGVFVGSDGTLYIADTYNHRVLRLVRE
jgi:sugar lactone lactonase YvrE